MAASASSLPSKASLPIDLAAALEKVDDALAQAEHVLLPFTNAKAISQASKKLSPLDNARLNTTIGFVATSLVYAHLRVSGMDLKSHPIMGEVQRTKQLFSRCEEAEKLIKARSGEKLTSLDTAAAGRMITASISANNFASQTAASGVKRARPEGAADAGQKKRKTEEEEAGGADSEDSSDFEEDKPRQKGHEGKAHAGRRDDRRDKRGNNDKDRRKDGGHRDKSGGRDGRPGKPAAALSKKRDSIKAAPQPSLSHLNWKQEMERKFG